MNPGMQWLSLIGGFVLSLIGVRNLYVEHDAIILIIGVLIIGFTLAKMNKTKQRK